MECLHQKKIIDEALSLPVSEKVELVDRLLCNIDGIDKDIEAKWVLEAESRLDTYESGKIQSISLEDVLAKYK